MRNRMLLAAACCLAGTVSRYALAAPEPDPTQTCSTFLLSGAGSILVGHNLDDSIETPGMIVVNPRGVPKQGPRYRNFWPFAPGKNPSPRLEWASRYGLVTYNVFGREFPDGSMNEVGLYVGEMTLRGTIYPTDPGLVRLYHFSCTVPVRCLDIHQDLAGMRRARSYRSPTRRTARCCSHSSERGCGFLGHPRLEARTGEGPAGLAADGEVPGVTQAPCRGRLITLPFDSAKPSRRSSP